MESMRLCVTRCYHSVLSPSLLSLSSTIWFVYDDGMRSAVRPHHFGCINSKWVIWRSERDKRHRTNSMWETPLTFYHTFQTKRCTHSTHRMWCYFYAFHWRNAIFSVANDFLFIEVAKLSSHQLSNSFPNCNSRLTIAFLMSIFDYFICYFISMEFSYENCHRNDVTKYLWIELMFSLLLKFWCLYYEMETSTRFLTIW